MPQARENPMLVKKEYVRFDGTKSWYWLFKAEPKTEPQAAALKKAA